MMDAFDKQPQKIPFVHLCNPLIGHITSTDCWCEPKNINIVKNKFGITVCVVLHEDYVLTHRSLQLAEREAGIPQALHWIDRVVDGALDYPTDTLHDIRAIPRKE